MRYSVVSEYIKWHFYEMPQEIKRGWFNYLRFYWNFFSVPILLKTFFSPWRRYRWSYGRGFSFSRFFEVSISNLMMRILGMIMRSFLIIAGFIVDFLILILGLAFLVFWFSVPIIIVVSFILGVNYLFI